MFGTVQSIDLVYQPLSNRQLTWIVLVESEVSSLLRMLQIFAYQFLVCALCWVLLSVGQCDRQLYTEVSVMFPGRYRGARLAHSGDLRSLSLSLSTYRLQAAQPGCHQHKSSPPPPTSNIANASIAHLVISGSWLQYSN